MLIITALHHFAKRYNTKLKPGILTSGYLLTIFWNLHTIEVSHNMILKTYSQDFRRYSTDVYE